MGLKYILTRVESDLGINNPELNPEQRALVLQAINEAAAEVYDTTDLPVALKECDILASSEARLALPAFIGECRAVRLNKSYSLFTNYKYTIRDIRQRYCGNEWIDKWTGFRIVNESAIANELLSQGPLQIVYPFDQDTDGPLTITIVGETSNSNRDKDSVLLNANLTNGTKGFIDITSIQKSRITRYNTIINDEDGNALAVIYADQLESRYILVDISKYPNLEGSCNGEMMEVLYKPRLGYLNFDEDTFPLQGYDDIIVIKTKQLFAEDSDASKALALFAKGAKRIKDKIYDKEGTVQAKLTAKRNPLYNLNRYYWSPYRIRRFF